MSTRPIKGVNIGGWLVLETWMTPSLFGDTGSKNERELSATDSGRRRIAEHHQAFITEEDLDWIRSQEITIIRVPIGHWIFGDTRPYVDSINRLDWLFEAAAKRNIQVLLCMHAAPGGQNDEEHGGYHAGKRIRPWLNDLAAQVKTIRILEKLAERYGQRENLWGLQLLNEPTPDWLGLRLARFYRRAFIAVRPKLRSGVYTVFSDGYAPLRLTNALGLMGSKHHPVAIDCHFYYCFSNKDKHRTFEGHLAKIRRMKKLITILRISQPLIVGEWSAMLPGKGSHDRTQAFVNAQKVGYGESLATFYWNYKTEAPGRWNYRDMIEGNGYEI